VTARPHALLPAAVGDALAQVAAAGEDAGLVARWLGDCTSFCEGRPPQGKEIEELLAALHPHLLELLSRLSMQAQGIEADDSGIFWMDSVLAHYIGALGPGGAEASSIVKEDSSRAMDGYLAARGGAVCEELLLRLWCGEDPKWLRALAATVWVDEVWPYVTQVLSMRSPALSASVITKSVSALWRRGREVQDSPRGPAVTSRGQVGALLRSTASASVPSDFTTMLRCTETVAAHRLLRLLVLRGFHASCDPRVRDPRLVIVKGGFAALAAILSLRGKSVAGELRQALVALQHLHLDVPGGEAGGILTWTFRQEAPGRQAELRIVLGDVLLPGLVHCFSKGTRDGREARKLVPVPTLLPPFAGARFWHSAQATLQILVLRELREHAATVASTGSIPITPERWSELADEAGVRVEDLAEVLRVWAGGSDGTPAFLVEPSPGRFTLASAYDNELAFILSAGDTSVRARRAVEIGRRRKGRLFVAR